MFSSRADWDAPDNPLALARAARERAGLPLLDLTESNPTRVGISPPPGLLDALADPRGLVYDPDPRGLATARRAVADAYAARGHAVDPARLLLTAGTSEAYGLLLRVLCDPGDAILVGAPGYPLLDMLAALEGVRVDRFALSFDGARFAVDPRAVQAALTPRTRAVAVVNPGNPTGSFLRRGELAALAAIARARDLALIADEVFADFPAGPDAERVTCAAASSPGALAFSLGGLSKSCGLPQLKLAWILAGGPPALADAAIAHLAHAADAYLSVGTPVQVALPSLLVAGAAIADRIRARVAAGRAALSDALGDAALPAEGGWTAVIRMPRSRTDEQWALALLDDGVAVHPGYLFDFADESRIVVSLLPPPDILRAGAARIAAAVRG